MTFIISYWSLQTSCLQTDRGLEVVACVKSEERDTEVSLWDHSVDGKSKK